MGALVNSHLSPESADVQIPAPDTAAASLEPSPDEATLAQSTFVGALLKAQDAPEFEDIQTPPASTAATMFVPFVEHAIAVQLLLEALLRSQFVPEFVE